MTSDERKRLSLQAASSPTFRATLLNDPITAAATIGVTLTDAEADICKAYRQAIEAAGRAIDDQISKGKTAQEVLDTMSIKGPNPLVIGIIWGDT